MKSFRSESPNSYQHWLYVPHASHSDHKINIGTRGAIWSSPLDPKIQYALVGPAVMYQCPLPIISQDNSRASRWFDSLKMSILKNRTELLFLHTLPRKAITVMPYHTLFPSLTLSKGSKRVMIRRPSVSWSGFHLLCSHEVEDKNISFS